MADSGCEDTVPSKPPSLKMPDESDASMRARLYNSLSQSFPHSQLYKALHGEADLILGSDNFDDDDDDSLYGDHLSNSCFASLRMDRRDSDDFDDDLRSLEWLQSEDLLKNIGGEKLDKEDGSEDMKENEDIKPDITLLQRATGQAPPHLPYQPQKHVNTKPPYSFSCLIFMAVENSPQKRLPVKDIYNWILTQFPYFQNAPTGWKNSVRHNLSLNKCFKKVDKDKGQSIGKGSLWCIDPAYRPNLLQALRKTPYHPYHQLQMTSTAPQHYGQYQSLPSGCRSVLPLTQRPIPNTVSPHLFPFLSRRLAQTSFDVDSEMKDVAQTLVSLKSSHKEATDNSSGTDIGPTWKYHKRAYGSYIRQRSDSPVTITGHPHSDHAYSSTRLLEDDLPSPSSSSSIDEEYDFGSDADDVESDFQSDMEWNSDDKDEVDGDIPSPRRVKPNVKDTPSSASKTKKLSGAHEMDDDEQKKIHEGASALLNLAGLFVNNTGGNRNSGSGVEKQKNGVKKVKAKKPKLNSKADKGGVKKKIVKKNLEKQQEKKAAMKKRSNIKRKNAGSNGKYDNDQFTTFKKASKTSDGIKKGGSSKNLKSVNGDGQEKVNSSKIKNKSGAAKKGQEKHKLKLSKSFGAANKISRARNNNNDIDDSDVKSKAVTKAGAKVKKKETQKRVLKVDIVPKSRKFSRESSPRARLSSKGNDVKNESAEPTTNNNNNNNDDYKHDVPDVKVMKYNDKSDFPNGHDSSLKKESDSKLSVKKEIISPAGDAPLVSKFSNSNEERDIRNMDIKSEESSDDDENDASKFLQKIGLMATSSASASSSPSISPSASSSSLHKSPHFTRFSKKKAGMS